MKNHKAIYSTIIGDYDEVPRPGYLMQGWDYVLFTDQDVASYNGVWEVREPGIQLEDNILTSRWHKINPHKALPEYGCSIWIDANITTETDFLEQRVRHFEDNGTLVASFLHPDRNCAYEEAEACFRLGKDKPERIRKAVEFLKQESYPRGNGLFEQAVLFRQHTRERVVELDELWWRVYQDHSHRDQLSFDYCLWKLGIDCEHISEDRDLGPRSHRGFDIVFNHKFVGDTTSQAVRDARAGECLQLAKLYLKYRRFERAASAAEESLQMAESVLGWNLLGVAAVNSGDLDTANRAFVRALSLAPENKALRANSALLKAMIETA